MMQFADKSAGSKKRVIFFVCAALLVAISILGNPYRYYQYNSGRYLVLPYQAMDPELFPSDQVVTSLSRYRSLFYESLGPVHRMIGASPLNLEITIGVLYIASKILIIVALYLIAQGLTDNFWLVLVLAGWACHQKSTFVGGVGLNMPTLTHLEVVYVMALFGLYFLLSGRPLLFWFLLSAGVFVHSLAAFHLAISVAPLFLQRKPDTRHWIGGGIFAACCLLYLFLMAPPPLTVEEGKIFLEAERASSHISPFKFKVVHWAAVAGMLAVGIIGQIQFNREDKRSSLLAKFALSGAVGGIVLAFLAVASHSVKLALFQPLRTFFWVGLFCSLLLAAAAVRAFETSLAAGIILAAPLVLLALDSRWAVIFVWLALSYLGIRWFLARWWSRGSVSDPGTEIDPNWGPRTAPFTLLQAALEKYSRYGLSFIAVLILAAWALGSRQPFESLRAPVLLFPALLCLLATVVLNRQVKWRPLAAALMIVYCLAMASVESRRFFDERADADWDEIRRWCRQHTAKTDRFVTPPEKQNFRCLSLRSTRSERVTQLAWVDPYVYLQNTHDADLAARGYTESGSDLNYLLALAKEWKCEYLIARGALPPGVTPRYRAGPYSVVEVGS